MKLSFIIDNTVKAKYLKRIITNKYKNYSPQKADVIVVIGGDGFMLKILKKYQKYNKNSNALVVKLVDTKDLKSLPVWECQFESGRGHQ